MSGLREGADIKMIRQLRRQQKKKRRQKSSGPGSGSTLQRATEDLRAGNAAKALESAIAVLVKTGREDATELACLAASEMGSPETVLNAYSRLVGLFPTNPSILNDYGLACLLGQNVEKAESLLQRALKLQPDDIHIMANLGQALLRQEKYHKAEVQFRQAIKVSPKFAGGFSGLGTALEKQEKSDEAIRNHRQAYRLAPQNAEFRNKLEAALKENGVGYDERERMYKSALINDPNDIEAAILLACVYRDTNRRSAARELIDEWIKKENTLTIQERGHLREVLAELQFLGNDFASAWPNYHWRFKWREMSNWYPSQPEWQGEPLENKTILVSSEQGVGDQVMFSALLPVLQACGAHVILESDPRLVPLFLRSFPKITCVPAENPPNQTALSSCIDFYVAMGSIGCQLWSRFKSCPPKPYLRADPIKVEELKAKYKCSTKERIVGISWKSPRGKRGPVKSISLTDLVPIFRNPDMRFVNLQYGNTALEIGDLERDFGIHVVQDIGVDQDSDLDTYAAQLAAMDTIITVSNSTAHLAGALGVQTFVLLPATPQWKWGGSGEQSEWYSHVVLRRHEGGKSLQQQIRRIATDIAACADKEN